MNITKREQKEERKRKKIKESTNERKTKQPCAQGAGRVPRTRLRLRFTATISPLI